MKAIEHRFRLFPLGAANSRFRQSRLYLRVPAAFSFPAAERVRGVPQYLRRLFRVSDRDFCIQPDKPTKAAQMKACFCKSRRTTGKIYKFPDKNSLSASSKRLRRAAIFRFCLIEADALCVCIWEQTCKAVWKKLHLWFDCEKTNEKGIKVLQNLDAFFVLSESY